jgi:hypothetical protein
VARTGGFLYDLQTTRRFRLTGYKIACVRPGVLCASQHCEKFLKVIKQTSVLTTHRHSIAKTGKFDDFCGKHDKKMPAVTGGFTEEEGKIVTSPPGNHYKLKQFDLETISKFQFPFRKEIADIARRWGSLNCH